MGTFRILLFLSLAVWEGLTADTKQCTRAGRFCVWAAKCDEIRQKCVCPHGFKGDGLLDCVDKDYGHCEITRDPRIMQFSRSRGSLYLPCRHNLAKFLVGNAHKAMQFHVFGTSELVSFGRYFENEVEVQLVLGKVLFQGGQEVFVEEEEEGNAIYFRINENGTSRTTDENGWLANGADWVHTPWGHDLDLDFAGVLVTVTFDEDNIMTLAVAEFDTRVKFRPYTRGERPQKRIPGVSITSPPFASFADPKCQFPHVLCATPDDARNHMKAPAKSLGLSINQYLMYVMLKNAPQQLRGPYKVQCSLVCSLFKTKCPEERRALAVKTCFPLLSRAKLLACVLAIPTRYTPMDLFQMCVHHVCQRHYSSCESVHKFTKSCPRPKALRKMDCGPPPKHVR
ncbi:uncharacterized protein LOC143294835 [Babylonia areolata]|uniref:uncharacterized protein LOC143294835 n=1 Tax=Babylonia areolata TaxID=304850 RepID=UPI003FD3BD89